MKSNMNESYSERIALMNKIRASLETLASAGQDMGVSEDLAPNMFGKIGDFPALNALTIGKPIMEETDLKNLIQLVEDAKRDEKALKTLGKILHGIAVVAKQVIVAA